MGLLPNIAAGPAPGVYAQSPEEANATAGWIISAYALGVVVGAPTIAAAAARWPRKRLLLALLTAFTLGTVASALLPTFELVLVARFLVGAAARRLLRHRLARGREPHGAGQARPGRRARAVGPHDRERHRRARDHLARPGRGLARRLPRRRRRSSRSPSWPCSLAVPWQAGDPRATMKRELRAFSRAQVWFALGIGAIGFGGLFAVYSYVAPLATEVTGLAAGDRAGRAHRVRPRHDVGNLVGGRLADWSVRRVDVPVLRGPRGRPRAARLHGGEPRRAVHRRVPRRRGLGGPVARRSRRGSWTSRATASRSPPRSTTRPSTSATASVPCSAVSPSPAASATSPRSGSASCSRSRACCSRSASFALDRVAWSTRRRRAVRHRRGRGRRA